MFQGRIGVGRYWGSVLVLVLLSALASGILVAGYYLIVFPMLAKSGGLGMLLLLSLGGMVLGIIPALIMLPYSIGLQIRRFHDIGLSGWMILVLGVIGGIINFFLPAATSSGVTVVWSPVGIGVSILLLVVGIVIACWPGTQGPNKYGEQTKYSSVWTAIKGKK